MALGTGFTIGIWSDLDSPELRAAIQVFDRGTMPPIRYLDGAGVPPRFKVRRVPGEPVPMILFAAMIENPADPWATRDRMVSEMNAVEETIAPEGTIARGLAKFYRA
jgi:hypothetical protein